MISWRQGWISAMLLALLTIIALVIFQIARAGSQSPAYVIKTTEQTDWVLPENMENLPRFDPVTRQWTVRHREIADLSKHMVDNWEGPDAFVRTYFVFTMDAKADSNGVKHALADLTRRGICYAGIVDFPPRDLSPDHMAVVFQIVEVQDENGDSQRCRQRTPSAVR
jgi:hypothetical protein